MECNFIRTEHLCTEFCYYFIVDLDCASLDKLISFTARAYTGIGEILVQTDRLIRVDVVLLVFYALLKRVLCVRVII